MSPIRPMSAYAPMFSPYTTASTTTLTPTTQTSTQHLSKDEIAGISVALVLVLCIATMTIWALCTTPEQRQYRHPATATQCPERSPSPSRCCGLHTSRLPSAAITGVRSPSCKKPITSSTPLPSKRPETSTIVPDITTPTQEEFLTRPISAYILDAITLHPTTDESSIRPSSRPAPSPSKRSLRRPKFHFFPTTKPSTPKPAVTRPKPTKRHSTTSLSRLPSLTLLGRRSTAARREEALLKARLKDGYTREIYRMRDVDMGCRNVQGAVGVGEVVMGGLCEEGRGFVELSLEYEREVREVREGWERGEKWREGVRGRGVVVW